MFCEVTVTMTFDHHNLNSLFLSPIGHLCQILRNSHTVFRSEQQISRSQEGNLQMDVWKTLKHNAFVHSYH